MKALKSCLQFLKEFSTEPYTEDKCNKAIESAIFDYYKINRKLSQSLAIKQRVKRSHRFGEEDGVLLITRDNTVKYISIANAPFSEPIDVTISSVKGVLRMRYHCRYR